MARERRTYTSEFKKQMVLLYENGKSRIEIVREYELTPSSLDRWISQYRKSGSFQAKYNRSEQEQEMIELRQKLKRLEMENDILKQAALIMGRK